MICGSFTLDNIPDGRQDAVANGFQTNVPPPTSVAKVQNPDGTWKVTATWPPCPAGATASHDPGNS